MFKRIVQTLLLIGSVFAFSDAKSVVIIADISQGISKSEGIEVMTLADPKKSPIYEDGDLLAWYAFTEKGRKKIYTKFVDRSTDRRIYNKICKVLYPKYFNVVKYGVKKSSKKKSFAQKDIVFLIDTSGSMKKNDLENIIKNALKKTLEKKGEKVNIALVVFDGHKTFDKSDNSRVILDFTNDIGKLSAALDSLEFTHFNTMLGDGMEKAVNMLKNRKIKSKMIILISDGDDVADQAKAIKQISLAKQSKIDVKPFAFGGANLNSLKNFSSNGKVYDITRGDFDDVVLPPKSQDKDTLFQNFASLSSAIFKKNKSDDGILIIYSTMMENSNLYDFNMIPNLSDDLFYKEVKEKLKEEHLNINFHGLKTYVRLIGNPSAKKENELRIFWERFINEHNGKVKWISKEELTLDEMGY